MEEKTTYETPKKRVYIIQSTITVAVEANNSNEAIDKFNALDYEHIADENIEIIGKLNK